MQDVLGLKENKMFGLRSKLNRRVFLKVFSLSALASLWPRKSAGTVNFQTNKNIPPNYIQNRDVPGFFIRSANPFLGVDAQEWGLAVTGRVKHRLTLGYEDLFGFPVVSQVSRLKCVECWSAKAKWEGFRFQDLVDRVQPDAKAKYVTFQSADSYYESYALEELLKPRVLMVLRMNDQPLTRGSWISTSLDRALQVRLQEHQVHHQNRVYRFPQA